jgi:enhancing lycopene biosynthesis protein 2
MKLNNKRFAVLLSGCGYLDGAEVNEAVLTMLYIDKLDIEYDVFAFNEEQKEVINHVTKKQEDRTRNMMSEACRISRNITDATTLNPQKYHALIIPGGMGVAKNFSNLALAGNDFEVKDEVAKIISEFVSLEKPIGAICISPAIVAKVMKDSGYKPLVTLGDENEILHAIEVEQELCNIDDIVVDHINKIVTTPAYMLDGRISEISTGIGKLILKIQELCR